MSILTHLGRESGAEEDFLVTEERWKVVDRFPFVVEGVRVGGSFSVFR